MRVTYLEGESRFLAEADELSIQGSTLTVMLRSGKVLRRSFPSQDVLEQFFDEVILTSGDKPIRLENTNFAPGLGAILDAWDSMYDD